jgi:hypothetical protein
LNRKTILFFKSIIDDDSTDYKIKKEIFMKNCMLLLSLLLFLTAFPVMGERIGSIDEVLKPQMIRVDEGELLVVEKHHIFIYSLPDLKLKNRIGKEGEGPGEFQPDPARTIIFSVHPGYILAESRNKIIYFDRRGRYLRERIKPPGLLQVLPLGPNFAVLRILYGPEGENYFAVSIMDQDLKEIREIYRQKFFSFKGRTIVIPDGLNFCVMEGKLIVEQSPDGFVIGIYDQAGNKINRIERPFEKIPVTDNDREEAFADLLQIPSVRRAIQEQGKNRVVDNLKSTASYPDFLAPIQYIMADQGRLVVKTPLVRGDREEFLVMSLEGKIIKKIYLPKARKVDFLVRMQGDKNYFTIHGNGYYYLKLVDTGDDETWELYMERID